MPDATSPVPQVITIETTCTPAEVRTDPGKKQDILHAVNTAQVRIFLTYIDIDATGLLTPDVISTSNFIQSINSAAWEYAIYKKHFLLHVSNNLTNFSCTLTSKMTCSHLWQKHPRLDILSAKWTSVKYTLIVVCSVMRNKQCT